MSFFFHPRKPLLKNITKSKSDIKYLHFFERALLEQRICETLGNVKELEMKLVDPKIIIFLDFIFSGTVATVPFNKKDYEEQNSKISAITKDFHDIAQSIESVQEKLKEVSVPRTPQKTKLSPRNSPSTKSKKRSLKTQLYNERLKRLKQDKVKAQYDDDSDESSQDKEAAASSSSKNGKNDSRNNNLQEKEETELSKIQRDLAILNQQIQDDLEERKRKGVKLSFHSCSKK